MPLTLLSLARGPVAPDIYALVETLRPLLAPANAGGFMVRYQAPSVIVEQESFTGVNVASCQAAVTAAAAETAQTLARGDVDAWTIAFRALVLTLVDQINILRTQPTTVFAAVTDAQAFNAIKNRANTL